MPVFNRYEPPSPSTLGDEDLEKTFLKDVDQFHDDLPQPFRRINKLLEELLELVWVKIEAKTYENQFLTSSNKGVEAILYEEELCVDEQITHVKCSGEYTFLYSVMGITVFEMPAFTQSAQLYFEKDKEVEETTNMVNVVDVCLIKGKDEKAILMVVLKEERGG